MLPQWVANPGLPQGFTFRGIVGMGLTLGGLYNAFTSVIDGAEICHRRGSAKDRHRLARWGWFGGVGLVVLGVGTLLPLLLDV